MSSLDFTGGEAWKVQSNTLMALLKKLYTKSWKKSFMQISKKIPKKTTKNATNLFPPSHASWYCNVYTLVDYLKFVEEAQLESATKKLWKKDKGPKIKMLEQLPIGSS